MINKYMIFEQQQILNVPNLPRKTSEIDKTETDPSQLGQICSDLDGFYIFENGSRFGF